MTEPTGLPPELEAVRRLLADARHDGVTPPEVVARLDETLASLVAERRDETAPDPDAAVAPVVDLGARRRRLAGVGLLAAAAVVVAGVAIGQALPRMQGSDAGSAGESTAAERDFAAEDSGGSDAGGDAGSQELGPQSSRKSGTPVPLAAYPTLASGDADLDQELLDLRSSASNDGQAPDPGASAEALDDCDVRGTGRGRRVFAEVDGQVGVVVFRRTDGAAQQVDLYVCGDPQAVRTLTLPAP